jgi:hypothetical protein
VATRVEAGRRAIAEWENENGPLTPDEIADGSARARALLGRPVPDAPAQTASSVGREQSRQ